MILNCKELKNYEKKVTMVDGGFDPLHIGHLRYFEEATKLGLPVFCNVRHDEYIKKNKQRTPLLPQEQRIKLIDSLKTISYAYLCSTSTADTLRALKPSKYVKGADWKERGLPEEELKICNEYDIEVVYLDTNIDSSTNIYNVFSGAVVESKNKKSLETFESLIFSQKEVVADYYDDHYFKGQWRSGGNDYSIEKRRTIEAKNPQNIKDIFNPKNVLDVGCGPGALMYFLHELGVKSYGIDFSKAAKEMAPEEIRKNIFVGPVTEFHDFGVKFDLVICRELLEHLTVLQIKKVVKVLSDYTSKYLYVTTRFNPGTNSLFDVTDDTATDKTHITLLTKDLLRTLFILEGLKPRQDLEEKMDWKKFGRVMVFEKHNI